MAPRKPKSRKPNKAGADRWELPRFLLGLGLIALILRAFVFAPFSIPTGSMLPRLLVGDYLFVTKWNYGWSRYSLPFALPLFEGRIFGRLPARGDIVVFKFPGTGKVDYVKRVIGLPGDTIRVADGMLILNGKPVPRTRIADWTMTVSPNSPCRKQSDGVREVGGQCIHPRYRETLPGGRAVEVLDQGRTAYDDTAAVTVPPGHLFAMGDNRDDSLDSRASLADRGVGLVPVDHLVGRAGIGFFSTDGSATLGNPATWFAAARWDRIGMTY